MSKGTKVTPEELWRLSKEKTIEIAKLEGRKLKSWQVVYETIDRWSLKDPAAAEEKVKLIVTSTTVKEEIRDAARAVADGTHEQINASSQAQFLINVAIGEQKSNAGKVFERTALMQDGSRASITRIAEGQRMKTVELMTAPEPAKKIKNVSKQLSDSDDEELSVLTGIVQQNLVSPPIFHNPYSPNLSPKIWLICAKFPANLGIGFRHFPCVRLSKIILVFTASSRSEWK